MIMYFNGFQIGNSTKSLSFDIVAQELGPIAESSSIETATGQRTVAVSFVNYKYFLILNLSVMFFINESMYSLGHLYFLKSESALFYFLYKTSTLIFVIDSTSLKAILNLDFVNSRTSIHLILDFCVNLDSE